MKWYIVFVDKYNRGTRRFRIQATDLMTAREQAVKKNKGGQVSMCWLEW